MCIAGIEPILRSMTVIYMVLAILIEVSLVILNWLFISEFIIMRREKLFEFSRTLE